MHASIHKNESQRYMRYTDDNMTYAATIIKEPTAGYCACKAAIQYIGIRIREGRWDLN
jgi:hypothetical protein